MDIPYEAMFQILSIGWQCKPWELVHYQTTISICVQFLKVSGLIPSSKLTSRSVIVENLFSGSRAYIGKENGNPLLLYWFQVDLNAF